MAAPKISATDQRKIEVVIAKWKGKLTWDALVIKVKLELDLHVTRQTLSSYGGINVAYQKKKEKLRGVTSAVYEAVTISDVRLVEKVKHLKAEIEVLERNNAEQLRLIERMLSNAKYMDNVALADLVRKRPEEIVRN